ncbi:MAG TPA: hypothetical protein VKZ50_19720 [bacterium]|nr:hypothetical protein [bacterium]
MTDIEQAAAGSGRRVLRHCVATLAYRAAKALRGAPADFGEFRISDTARTPGEILAHMGDLLDWALSLAKGTQAWHNSHVLAWPEQIERFFVSLQAFDAYLASDAPLRAPVERLFQGPIADALTHVGQIATRRRLAGAPVRGENYFVAEITAGRVGVDQAPPRREFD